MNPGDLLAQRYRLEQLVGKGGQALVFAATDLRQQRRLAIKVARQDLAAPAGQEAREVLRWEAHLLRRLRHPALPRLHFFHHDGTSVWLARDLVIGQSLAEYAAGRSLPSATVQAWALQICDLLRYLHSRSPAVICGDIKPANLIVRQDGQVLLIDLGAAATRTRRPPRRPRPRHGTPGYAPPEQLAARELDERSDVFSLAVLCYELLTGQDPARTPLQFDLRRLDQASPAMAPMLRRALSSDMTQRPPSAAVLRAGLAPPLPPRPLALGYGVSINTQRDLLEVSVRHPRLLEQALGSGNLERWLIDHPAHAMGELAHRLRGSRQRAGKHQAPLDTLLGALAPDDGSSLLRAVPARLELGNVPLWRRGLWSRPYPLTLINPARHPLRWALECPPHPSASVRLLDGKKRLPGLSGVLAPGARIRLLLVASSKAGPQQGALQLHCGSYRGDIPWTATGVRGVPLGRQLVQNLADLDLQREDLLPAVEELLRSGAAVRWLREQGRRALAGEIGAAMAAEPDPLALRLLAGRLLHERAPERFPLIQLPSHQPADLRLVAGSPQEYRLPVKNIGSHPCQLHWQSRTNWVHIHSAPRYLAPGAVAEALLLLSPDENSVAGTYQITLELRAGDLPLNIRMLAEIRVEGWWQRLLRRTRR
jgi:serine/threonine protein kinase